MRVDQIDQVTINVKNLDESVKLFSETFVSPFCLMFLVCPFHLKKDPYSAIS